eukprot:5731555-Pleurochrysis_carterae.AAC.1
MEADDPPLLPLGCVADCPARIDANGYMIGSIESESYALSWVQPSVSDLDEDIQQYSQVVISTETRRLLIGLGEFVYITPSKTGRPAEIGQIETLFDAGADEDNAMMCTVRWLYRKEHVKGGAARSMHQREVLYSTH